MSLLSMHNRYWNGVPLLPRKPYRSTERCLITVILCTFLLVICGTFYLPELRTTAATRESLSRVYKHMQNAGPEFLIPAPPHAEALHDRVKPFNRHFNLQSDDDPHVLDDAKKLRAKIEEEHRSQKVLERPDILLPIRQNSSPAKPLASEYGKEPSKPTTGNSVVLPPASNVRNPVIIGGEDPNEEIRQKRQKIVEVRLLTTYMAILWKSCVSISKYSLYDK